MILLVTIFIVTTTALHSKSYNSWHLLYSDTYGVIKKIKDPKKKVTVVEFKSKSSRDTYINGAKTGEKSWNNKKDKIIKWDFNFNKNFVIMVSIKTKKGIVTLFILRERIMEISILVLVNILSQVLGRQ